MNSTEQKAKIKDLDLISTDVAGLSYEKIEALLREVETVADLSEICQGFALKSGYLWYLGVFSNAKVSYLLTQYPRKWYSHYKAMKYWNRDPVLTTAFYTYSGFYWGDIPRSEEKYRLFFEDAAAHGVVDGFSVTARGPDNTQLLLCLATDRPIVHPEGTTGSHVMMRTHWFALQALEASLRVAMSGVPFDKSEVPLTEREISVLGLLAEGHGVKEIARREEISISRVNQYLDNLKGKFDTGTREEMLVKAARKGLVDRMVFPNMLNFVEEEGMVEGQDNNESKARPQTT